jgi:MFS family permease
VLLPTCSELLQRKRETLNASTRHGSGSRGETKLMRIAEATAGAISKGVGYVRRQPRDWKTAAVRNSTSSFSYYLTLPYLSIYIVALGASGGQIGLVNSIGQVIGGIFALFSGWLVDKSGVKPVMLIALGITALSYLVYGIAQYWMVAIIAMSLYWIGWSAGGTACATVCGTALKSDERATTMNICHSLAAGVAVVSPIIGALLVTSFGGVNIEGIRPLFFIVFIVWCLILVFIATRLSNTLGGCLASIKSNIFQDISQVFKRGRNLKRMIVFNSLGSLHLGLILPFTQIFAYQVKGAEQYVLGAMVSGMALTPIALGVPFGRLADRIGRKKALYLLIPLLCASNLVLILAPSPGFLIAAGVLQGFYWIVLTITATMSMELVPKEQMGRWIGIIFVFRGLIIAVAALLGGAIWEFLGPASLFLGAIAVEFLIRIPLLKGMPETLVLEPTAEQPE